ncbi:unnamed protein product [Sphagnum balticum]
MLKNAVRESKALFINEALSDLDISRKAWSYWKHIFADDEDILDLMDLIEGILEANLTRRAATGAIGAAFAIFALKHNHHWSDRPQAAEAPPAPVQKEFRPDTSLQWDMGGGVVSGIMTAEELAAHIARRDSGSAKNGTRDYPPNLPEREA